MSLAHLHYLVWRTVMRGQPWEGSGDKAELAYLASLAKRPGVKLIAEIGFNAGLSSYTFLKANPDAHVYSFDLGQYEYVKPAKAHIDKVFPGRHTLTIGNSLSTVPKFTEDNPDIKVDLAFVDGGHDYEVAKADLVNMKRLAKPHAMLVTDDLTPWKPWGEGPTRAWQEAVQEGLVVQDELYRDGRRVETVEPPGERSWVLGRYA